MTIRLYKLTRTEAFRLAQRSVSRLGFDIYLADERKGFLRAQKKNAGPGQIIFFDIRLTGIKNVINILLVSNYFSENTCNFTADAGSEVRFLETLHDLLQISPPGNPFSLSSPDGLAGAIQAYY